MLSYPPSWRYMIYHDIPINTSTIAIHSLPQYIIISAWFLVKSVILMVNLANPIPTRQLVVIFRCIPIKSPLTPDGLGLVYTQDIRIRYTDLFFLIYHQLFLIYWISIISPIKIEPVLNFPLCQYELPTMSILFWASSLHVFPWSVVYT